MYSFIIGTESYLTADSPLHDVITAAASILRNPRIGLIIKASGHYKLLFEDKIKLLGIEKNVAFVDSNVIDDVSFYNSIDLYVEADTSEAGEEHILKAIAAATPICTYQTDLANDMLVDGQSSFLVEDRDSFALGKKINQCVNNPAIRSQFAARLADISKYRIAEDESVYKEALEASITQIFE